MFALIKDGIVVQAQQYAQNGFIKVPNDTCCGMVDNGDSTFSNPEKSQPQEESEFRAERDQLLLNTDKYMVSDFPLTADQKNEITTYRQALRDSTSAWTLPVKPSWA